MRPSSKPPVALAATALLAVGGGAYAIASPGTATITVCVKQHGGTLYQARNCARHDHQLSWNREGPTGPRGATGATGATGIQGQQGPTDPAGPQGPPGQAATRLFGYVHEGINANTGTPNVVYGSGVIAVDDFAGDSTYMVTFCQSIANCVVQAEPGVGNPSGGSNTVLPTAIPSVNSQAGNDSSVVVKFENPSGAIVDTSFVISAFC
jgi:hypothetical protein